MGFKDDNTTLERIIGGEDPTNHIPWQVSIQKYNITFTRWDHFCGGTILNQFTILSAAHCFYDFTYITLFGAGDRRYESYAFRIVAGTPFVQTILDTDTFPHVQASSSIYLTSHFRLR